MNTIKDSLLDLRFHSVNLIYLAISPRGRTYPKEIGFNATNLITLSIKPSNGTAPQNVSIGLINC